MISHGNLLVVKRSIVKRTKLIPGKDVYIGYLPLAHVLELMSEVIEYFNNWIVSTVFQILSLNSYLLYAWV